MSVASVIVHPFSPTPRTYSRAAEASTSVPSFLRGSREDARVHLHGWRSPHLWKEPDMSPHARHLVPVAASLLALCGLGITAPAASAAVPAITSAPAVAHSRPPLNAAVPEARAVECDLVRLYVTLNPSMNKPRGDQSTPDHRTWAAGC
jgi:hypothetical protein